MPRKPPPPPPSRAGELLDSVLLDILKRGKVTAIAGATVVEVDIPAPVLDVARKRVADRARLERNQAPAQWLAAKQPRRPKSQRYLDECRAKGIDPETGHPVPETLRTYRREMGQDELTGEPLDNPQEPAA